MKKNAVTATIIVATIFATSCKKDKDVGPIVNNNPSTTSNTYSFPLTIGSYWIYESVNMDSSYNITSTQGIDSVFIAKDTIVNGSHYFQKRIINVNSGSSYAINYFIDTLKVVRDSAGYIVDQFGKYIKHDDFTNILNTSTYSQPQYTIVSRMTNKDSAVTVPAGTFTSINYQSKLSIQEPIYVGNRTKYSNDIMANNVGVILQTACYFQSPTKLGIQLLRYHIAN